MNNSSDGGTSAIASMPFPSCQPGHFRNVFRSTTTLPTSPTTPMTRYSAPILTGTTGATSGRCELATLVTGATPAVNLDVTPRPSGATTNDAPLINLLEPTAVYFTY